VLDRFLDEVRQGTGRALVVRGEPGVGKTALLDHLVEHASGCRLARAAGVESEMELAYAGLHQLLTPTLHRLERLPGPQREALHTAFGLGSGSVPDRFLVGLAALSLLAEVAEEHPLICVVDDEQWLDRASAQVLGFVARRLVAEPVGLIFAARLPSEDLSGLPELVVVGLGDADSRALLSGALAGPLDAQVTDRLVAETGGNPLALLELPRGLTTAELAGGFALPDAVPLSGRIEESFRRRLDALPAETRRLLLVAAAEPVGDPVLVWRAAERLGIPTDAATPAAEADLLEVGARVRFWHPLVRSAAYRSASLQARQQVHRALAEATDPDSDADRRAWHAAHATPGPDEQVADELERSAVRARGRGGVAAAAAFLRRAVVLTADPARRTERALAAAEASFQAGAFDAALGLLATAETRTLDGRQRARADLLRGYLSFASGMADDAAALLLEAAGRLESVDLDMARDAYVTAWGAALTAAGDSGDGDVLLRICGAVQALPHSTAAPRSLDLLLEGLSLLVAEGHGAAAAVMKRAATRLATIRVEEVVRWGWVATGASAATWDADGFRAICERQVQLLRDAGAVAQLPLHLGQLSQARSWEGDLAGAAALIAEAASVATATGSRFPPSGSLRLLALQGNEAEASVAIATQVERAAAGGQAVPAAYWAAAVLYNGLGRYQEAAAAARQVTANTLDPWHSMWALPELVEAAARAGDPERAREALERLAETTRPAGTDVALGLEARCRAVLNDGDDAELLYRESIERLGRTPLRPELARAHLVYGEWLRRAGRRVDARDQLRTAHGMFVGIGMEAFAERARRELIATGERVRKRTVETGGELTTQEALVARLAREGLSNPEIGARLFLSARTVKYHLGKVFTKLNISSRAQLHRALPDDPATG
jgi:DNA-binding CsgD family transcriptional regulator/tetratricopeptide (TPR) repeat protein